MCSKIVDNKNDVIVFIIYIVIPFVFYFNFLYSNGFWAPGDGFESYVQIRKLYTESLKDFSLPLWNNKLISGTPFQADIQSSVFYLPNLLYLVFPLKSAFNYMFLLHLTLGGIFTYLYLKQVNIDKRAAFIGGIVFMFCGALNVRRGHITIQNSIIWLPFILYFYEKLISTRKKKYIVYMSIAYSFQILAGFIQIAFYTSIALLIYFLFSIKKYPSLKKWFIDNINFALITIGLTAIQIIPTLVLSQYVGRDKITYSFFESYSLTLKSIVMLFFPYIFGTHIPNTPLSLYNFGYFGDGNLTEYGFYVGIIPALFAINICITKIFKDGFVKQWATIGIVSLLLALGGSIPVLHKLMFHVPIYNMFRVPARILFIFDFALVVLFSIQLNNILKNEIEFKKLTRNIIIMSLFIVITSSFVIYALHTFMDYLPAENLQNVLIKGRDLEFYKNNFAFKNSAVFVPISVIVISSIFMIVTTIKKEGLKRINLIVLALIVTLDLHSFSFYHENVFVTPQSDGVILNKLQEVYKSDERIWPVIGNNDFDFENLSPDKNIYWGINSINGYVTFLPQTYKDILGFDERGVNSKWLDLIINNELISSLNTKYIIVRNEDSKLIEHFNSLDINNATRIQEFNAFSMKSPNGKDVAIKQQKVDIKPNSVYRIKVELKEPVNSDPLYIDLYGGSAYDNADQELDVLPSNKKEYSRLIYSGSQIPDEVYFRVFTFSKEDIDILGCSLEYVPMSTKVNQNGYVEISKDDRYTLYKNNNVLSKLYPIKDLVETYNDYSNVFNMDLHSSALVDSHGSYTYRYRPDVELLKYRAGYAKARLIGDDNNFIVFSESYNPGWKAYIDGKKTDIYKVNGLIQGIDVPKGEHIIEFIYRPNEFYIGVLILLATAIYITIYLKLNIKNMKG